MKKAKIILSAVAVFAVIGGAFAFKAHRSLKPFYRVWTETTNPADKLCTYTTFTTLTTKIADAIPNALPITQTSYYTTPVAALTCPATVVYSAN